MRPAVHCASATAGPMPRSTTKSTQTRRCDRGAAARQHLASRACKQQLSHATGLEWGTCSPNHAASYASTAQSNGSQRCRQPRTPDPAAGMAQPLAIRRPNHRTVKRRTRRRMQPTAPRRTDPESRSQPDRVRSLNLGVRDTGQKSKHQTRAPWQLRCCCASPDLREEAAMPLR